MKKHVKISDKDTEMRAKSYSLQMFLLFANMIVLMYNSSSFCSFLKAWKSGFVLAN